MSSHANTWLRVTHEPSGESVTLSSCSWCHGPSTRQQRLRAVRILRAKLAAPVPQPLRLVRTYVDPPSTGPELRL